MFVDFPSAGAKLLAWQIQHVWVSTTRQLVGATCLPRYVAVVSCLRNCVHACLALCVLALPLLLARHDLFVQATPSCMLLVWHQHYSHYVHDADEAVVALSYAAANFARLERQHTSHQ